MGNCLGKLGGSGSDVVAAPRQPAAASQAADTQSSVHGAAYEAAPAVAGVDTASMAAAAPSAQVVSGDSGGRTAADAGTVATQQHLRPTEAAPPMQQHLSAEPMPTSLVAVEPVHSQDAAVTAAASGVAVSLPQDAASAVPNGQAGAAEPTAHGMQLHAGEHVLVEHTPPEPAGLVTSSTAEAVIPTEYRAALQQPEELAPTEGAGTASEAGTALRTQPVWAAMEARAAALDLRGEPASVAQADALYEQALDARRNSAGAGDLGTCDALMHRGERLLARGDAAAAGTLFREAFDGYRSALGDVDQRTQRALKACVAAARAVRGDGASGGSYSGPSAGATTISVADSADGASAADGSSAGTPGVAGSTSSRRQRQRAGRGRQRVK